MTGHRTYRPHKISKVMTTLSDMVMQCGGGGCCVLEQCFQYPRRAREPRDCGCQFALLHRADIAWPSVLANNLYFYYCLFFFLFFYYHCYYRYILFPPLPPSSSLRIQPFLSRSIPSNTVAMCAFRVSAFTMCAPLLHSARLSPLFAVFLANARIQRWPSSPINRSSVDTLRRLRNRPTEVKISRLERPHSDGISYVSKFFNST